MELRCLVEAATSDHVLDLHDVSGVAVCVEFREFVQEECCSCLDQIVVGCGGVLEVSAVR